MKLCRLCLLFFMPLWSGCSWLRSFNDAPPAENISLAPLFQNNMVLQSEVKVPVWGTCEPGRKVKVEILTQRVETVAASNGRWEVILEPMKPSGPLIMTVSGKEPTYIKNIMIGEVWICSGSRLELPLAQSEDGPKEVKNAGQYNLRLLRLESGKTPVWRPTQPNSCADFSAVAYFFGRRIHHDRRVALGVIHLPAAGKGESLDATMKQLAPFAFRGLIWDSGEETAPRLLTGMINDWRQIWNNDFPVILSQLPNSGEQWPLPAESRLAELREGQLLASRQLPNCFCVVTIDLGTGKPRELGALLAEMALASVYPRPGMDPVFPGGPVVDNISFDKDVVRIRFRNAGKGLASKNNQPLHYFAVAGRDGKFYWANALIKGHELVVWSGRVPRPTAVRYAWADNPLSCNLASKDGFLASSFRSDGPQATPAPAPGKKMPAASF